MKRLYWFLLIILFWPTFTHATNSSKSAIIRFDVCSGIRSITLYDDSTFVWRDWREVGIDLISNGTYSIDNDTLILNSTEQKSVLISVKPTNPLANRRWVKVTGPSGNNHPFYLTSININGDTCVWYGKNGLYIPKDEKIIQIDDAFRFTYKIKDDTMLNNRDNIDISISENRVFLNERWCIKGDTLYPKNCDGYPDRPMIFGQEYYTRGMSPGYFPHNFNVGYNELASLVLNTGSGLEHIIAIKRNKYVGYGSAIYVIEFVFYPENAPNKNDIKVTGQVIVDSYDVWINGYYNNPIRVGKWKYSRIDDTVIFIEDLPAEGVPFDEEKVIKMIEKVAMMDQQAR